MPTESRPLRKFRSNGNEVCTKQMTNNSYDLNLGDCVAGMVTIPEKSIDLVVTSPPYNLGKDYSQRYDDGQDRGTYLDWCAQWTAQIRRTPSLYRRRVEQDDEGVRGRDHERTSMICRKSPTALSASNSLMAEVSIQYQAL
jgi:DNA methylase